MPRNIKSKAGRAADAPESGGVAVEPMPAESPTAAAENGHETKPARGRRAASGSRNGGRGAAHKQSAARGTENVQAEVKSAAAQAEQLRRQTEAARRELDAVLKEIKSLRERSEAAVREAEECAQTTRERAAEARREFEDTERELSDAHERLRWLDQEARLEEDRCRKELNRLREEFRGYADDLRQESEEPRRLTAVRLAALRAAVPIGYTTDEPAAPAEGDDESVAIVQAQLRLEPPEERLARYLNDAWAVEDGYVEALKGMVDEVIDPALREALAEQGQTTRHQRDALAERLRALGREPSGGKGMFARLVGKLWEGLQKPGDDYDRTMQHLMKAYGASHFAVAMYRSMAALAGAIGDQETLALAGRHLEQEEIAAKRLESALVPLAALAAQLPREAPPEPEEE